MNERIGNNRIYVLAKEAGLIEFEQLAWNPELGSPTHESVAKARKFAELIVRECVEQCNINFVGTVGTHPSAHNRGVKKCIDNIKQHFGVE